METDLFSRSKVEESEWSEDRTKETSESQSEKRVLQPDDVQDESNRIKRSKVEAAKVEGHSESTKLIENEYVQDLRSNNADESVASKAIPPAELETVTHTSGQASDSEKNEPGLSALYQDFDEDYNEESDGDWNEGDSDNGDDVSDDDDSHDGFFLGVNDKYNELHGNSDDDGEDDQGMIIHYLVFKCLLWYDYFLTCLNVLYSNLATVFRRGS
jgi:hypothetical protein